MMPISGAPAAPGSWLISRNRLISIVLVSTDVAASDAQTRRARPRTIRTASVGSRRVALRTAGVPSRDEVDVRVARLVVTATRSPYATQLVGEESRLFRAPRDEIRHPGPTRSL